MLDSCDSKSSIQVQGCYQTCYKALTIKTSSTKKIPSSELKIIFERICCTLQVTNKTQFFYILYKLTTKYINQQ